MRDDDEVKTINSVCRLLVRFGIFNNWQIIYKFAGDLHEQDVVPCEVVVYGAGAL